MTNGKFENFMSDLIEYKCSFALKCKKMN